MPPLRDNGADLRETWLVALANSANFRWFYAIGAERRARQMKKRDHHFWREWPCWFAQVVPNLLHRES